MNGEGGESPVLRRTLLAALIVALTTQSGFGSPGTTEASFSRGDSNRDGVLELADAVAIVGHLFLGNPEGLDCEDAADVDDSGHLDLSDAVHLLRFLFSGDEPPAEPFPECGRDATRDRLVCRPSLVCAEFPAKPVILEPLARILLDELVAGEITAAGGSDVYELIVAAGQRIFIERTATSNAAVLNWKLEDVWGRVVLSNFTSLGNLGPTALMGGTYTLSILSEGAGTGTYEFRVADATGVEDSFVVGDTVSGEVTNAGQTHRLGFSAPPGSRLFLDLLSSSNSGRLNWQLEDSLGRLVFPRTSSLTDIGPLGLLGGDYELLILGESAAKGTYEFRLAPVIDDESAISIGDSLSGSIEQPGSRDVYTFSAAPGAVVFLDVTATSNFSRLNWILVDVNGRSVIARTTSLGDQGPIDLAGGDYRLTVLAEGGATGTYDFTLATVVDAEATIAVGDTVVGSIDAAGKTQRYALSLATNQRVFLDLLSTSNVAALNWMLSTVEGRTVVSRTTSLADRGPLALQAGDYTLSVVGEGGATGDFEFRLVEVVDEAIDIVVGEVVASAIDAPGQSDVFTFTAAANQVVLLDFLASSNTFGINWFLRDSLGRSIFSRTNALSDQGPFTLVGGDYALTVIGEGASTGSYEFQIVEEGTGNHSATGSPIDLDTEINGAIDVAGEVDMYTLTVPQGQGVYFDLLAGATNLRWTLLDPVGQAVFASALARRTTDDRGPFRLTAGTYMLSIEHTADGTPAYSFRVDSVTDALGSVAIGDVVSGTIASAGSTQRYTLDVPPGGARLYFDNQLAANDIFWSLVDPAGQAVFSGVDMQRVDSGDRGPFSLREGTHELRLDPSLAIVLPFQFQVHAVVDEQSTIAIGDPVSGAFAAAGSVHTFEFDVASTTRLFFDNLLAAEDVFWSLRDPAGRAVFGGVEMNNVQRADRGPFTLVPGRYRLVLDPSAQAVSAYEFLIRTSSDSERAISVGEVVSGTLTDAGSIHEFTLTVKADGARLYFDNQSNTSGLFWTLTDDAGTRLFSGVQMSSSISSDRGPLALAAGVYRLRLDASEDRLPSYQFQVHAVVDDEANLALDTEANGEISGPGAIAGFSFTVEEGQRVFFDLLDNSSSRNWTLIDPVGSSGGLFFNVAANSESFNDRGPINLRAGTYRLVFDGLSSVTPAYRFVIVNVSAELILESLTATPRVLVEGDTDNTIELTWRARNDGGGPSDIPAGWIDRVVLSRDRTLGNDDDVALDFQRTLPLAAHATYERTETLDLGAGLAPGVLRLFLLLDADDDVLEVGSEDNNSASVELNVVQPTDSTPQNAGGCLALDVEDGQSFPAGTALTLSGRAFGLGDSLNVLYTIDTSGSTSFVCGLDCNYDGSVDESDDWNGDATASCPFGSILDCEIGAALLVDRLLGENLATSHAAVIFAAGAGAVDLAPEEFEQYWVGPFDRDADEDGRIDLEQALRTTFVNGGAREFTPFSVPGGTNFDAAVNTSDAVLALAPPAERQILIYLTDGVPFPSNAVPTDADLERLAERGVEFLGLQLGAEEVTPALQRLADVIDSHPASSGTARPVRDVNDLFFEIAGSIEVVGVSVNGAQAESLDFAGRFFHPTVLQPGENRFVIEAVDAGGRTCREEIVLFGTEPLSAEFDQLDDVSTSVTVDYSRTTFNRAARTLQFEARACNRGDEPIDGPLLMVIDRISEASVIAAAPDGFLPDGRPYYLFLDGTSSAEGGGPQSLEPGGCVERRLFFQNALAATVDFDVSWLAQGNRPPVFASVPPVEALATRPYTYEAVAVDPDAHSITYRLEAAPIGMAIEADGRVTWTPSVEQIGVHSVEVVASDGRGGSARQAFAVNVVTERANRPPVFSSAPITHSPTGAQYRYQSTATDPDGDATSFARLEGPDGLEVDADGLVTWDLALPGDHRVGIRVADGLGAHSDQIFRLTVGSRATNPHAPTLFGTPATMAAVGRLYFYQPAARDLDRDDVLRFELTVAPDGMSIDEATGRVTWSPVPDQVGDHDVAISVSDGNDGVASQAWTITVVEELPNRAPVIESVPEFVAVVDTAYSYLVEARDPDGDAVTFDVVDPPAGLTIDASSGEVSWTPSETGNFVIAVRASDLAGASGRQVYELAVLPPNSDPVIDTEPVLEALAGATYRYDVDATDAEGQFLTYSTDIAPRGMTIDGRTGLLSWTPEPSQAGPHDVVVRVEDVANGSATQAFEIEVAPDAQPPVVEIAVLEEPFEVERPVRVCVYVSDNAAIAERQLLVDDVPVDLDEQGCTVITPKSPGFTDLAALARDPSGNEGAAARRVPVFVPRDPNDPDDGSDPDAPRPQVTLTSPGAESVVSGPVDIVGSISDDTPDSLSWEVRVARVGTDDFHTISEGSGEVTDGVLARFDPTVLPNDSYRIQVIGNDGGMTGGIEFQYQVAGELKFGNFRYDFVDLRLPIAGLPLAIIRNYDSLDTRRGDFGAGWRLELPGALTDSAKETGNQDAPFGTFLNEAFTTNSRVYVTKPDGRRVGFRFAPKPFFLFLWQIEFEPEPGVSDSLEAVSTSPYVWGIGGRFLEFVIPFNPRTYILTTREKVKYTIDEIDGLRVAEDPAGNTVELRPEGLISSTGLSALFERDAQNRITRVTEPDDDPDDGEPPAEIRYEYDGRGNLVRSIDQMQHITRYFYEHPELPNHLTRIEDPVGRDLVVNVFDDAGRLVGQCDARGDPATLEGCMVFEYDPDARVETFVDVEGFRSDLIYDERGNLIRELRRLEDGTVLETVRTYDERNNMLSVTDPLDNTLAFTYDERDNMLSRTEPGGRTWNFTWNDCGKMASEEDPIGNVTRFTYDEDCNLRTVTDPTGAVTEHSYNAFGQRTETIDAVGNRWQFGFDDLGYPSSFTDPSGNTETFQFNRCGDLERIVDRNGRRMDLEVDACHRIVSETWDTKPPRVTTYEYNAAGQLTKVSDRDSSVTMTYWETGLPRSVDNEGTPGAPRVITTYARLEEGELVPGYDSRGNLTHVMDSLGGINQFQYDALGRLTSIRQSGDPEEGQPVREKRVDQIYDAGSALREVRRFNDLAGNSPVITSSYDYDCGSCDLRLTSMQHRRAADDSILHDISLERDGVGNVVESTDAEGVHRFRYDGALRLLEVDHPDGAQSDESYTYDAVGNRRSSHTSARYELGYDGASGGNLLIEDDQFRYEYDAAGNMIRRTHTASGDATRVAYDHRSRLVEVVLEPGAGGEPTTVTYAYDASNRLIRRTVDGTSTHFFHLGLNPVLAVDDAGTVVSRRFFTPGLDEFFAEEVGGETRWLLTDHVGTVRDVLDASTTTINHYQYDAFGKITSSLATPGANEVLFQSREFDPVTGFGYFRARFYDPVAGRFLEEDPREPYGYDFLQNNPLLFVDPYGESTIIEYKITIGSRTFHIALHGGHHSWRVLGRQIFCIHIMLATYISRARGGLGGGWRRQIPLPWCKGQRFQRF